MAIIAKQESRTVQYRVCDFCTNTGTRAKPCFGCRRDVCSLCARVPDFDPFTGDVSGDYPPYICKACDEQIKPFEEKAREVRDRYEAELEAIERDYRAAVAANPA